MKKAGDIVTALFTDRFGPGFMENARSTSGLISSWKAIVSEAWPRTSSEQNADDFPAAAVHSRIRELERGVLLVEADHPGWIQILQTRQAPLLKAVQEKYPDLDIQAIAFRLSQEIFSETEAAELKAEAAASRPFTEKLGQEAAEERVGAESENEVQQPERSGDKPIDEEFYAALKGLEESIKKRNAY